MKRSLWALIAFSVFAFASPSFAETGPSGPVSAADSGVTVTVKPISDLAPVTDELLRHPDPHDWLMFRGNYEGYGFSALDQINKSNVKKLTLVWARAMNGGINEATPIIYKGVMFLPNPSGVVQAINATTGDLIWEYRRRLPSQAEMHGGWGQRMRSVFLYGDKLYYISQDNFVVALDARTGKPLWQANRGGDLYATNTNGAIVVNGVVIAGGNCQIAGFSCVVTGNDAETGKELWRNHLIPRPGEPGDETWGGVPYERRWMTDVWGALTYDPQLNLVYYGTSAVGPASEAQRHQIGATLQGTDTRVAVDPKTGKIAWEHQVLPEDNWDQDCTFEMMPITIDARPDPHALGMMAIGHSAGGVRRTLTGMPCKIGVIWSFDAANGKFLWAKSTVLQNLISSIDPDGKVTPNADMEMRDLDKVYHHCPTHGGGRNWNFSAYNPKTKVMYFQLQNLCADTNARTDRVPTPAMEYNTRGVYRLADGKTNVGRIDAVNVETGKTVWSWETRVSNYSPILATAGGVLFNGGMDRMFRAFDQDTGKVLWQTRLGSQASGGAVTYSVNGRQYIAVAAGGGYNAGPLSLTPGADGVSGDNTLYVFALPED